MTKILVALYVLGILAISAASRADFQTSGVFDKKAGIATATIKNNYLQVTGELPTVCDSKPRLGALSIDHTHKTIIFAVAVSTSREICIDVVGPRYKAAYDLSELPLIPGNTYKLKFLNMVGGQPDLSLKFSTRGLSPRFLHPRRQEIEGKIEVQGSEYQVVIKGEKSVSVISPAEFVGGFNGMKVWMAGYGIQFANSAAEDAERTPQTVAFTPVSVSTVEK